MSVDPKDEYDFVSGNWEYYETEFEFYLANYDVNDPQSVVAYDVDYFFGDNGIHRSNINRI